MFPTLAGLMKAVQSGELLANLNIMGSWRDFPTTSVWNVANVGTGAVGYQPVWMYLKTGVTASSSATGYCGTLGLGKKEAASHWHYDWDKKMILNFVYSRWNSDAQAVGRVQLKPTNAIGALAAQGLGIRVENYTMYAESYGTELKSTEIFTLTDIIDVQVTIILYPSQKIEFWINNKKKATHSDAVNIPTGDSGASEYLVQSIENGVTGSVDCYQYISQPKIWQER
jgi:hypothetical protein